MAKKAAKKAPVAKAKKPAKPVKAAPKSAPKAAAKPAKASKASVAKTAVKTVKPKATPAPAVKTPPKEKTPTKAPAREKAVKAAPTVVEEAPAKPEVPAPVKAKKEKKVKIDKTGLSEDQAKWVELHEKHKAEKPQNYSISGQFEAKKPLMHKLFGWGYILSNEYDRLEVLFEDGKRMLISNRKL